MIDWEKLFNDFKIPQRLVKGWSNVNCPFCKNPVDTHFNGGFSNKNPAYNCWRCGKHYWLEALSLVLRISPFEAKKVAYTYGGFFRSGIDREIENKEKKTGTLRLPGMEELTKAEWEYLQKRGFNIPHLQKKYGIRGGGIAGDWSYRIIIPIFYEGKLVSWTGRSILDRKTIDELKIPRYKNLSIEQSLINPKELLFNSDNCRKDSVILVEGPFDVLKMGDDAACSLGTSVTETQKKFIVDNYKKIFIAFDNEVSAQAKARKLGRELNVLGIDVEIVNICKDYYKDVFDEELGEWIKIPKNDPGELTNREALEIKKELDL